MTEKTVSSVSEYLGIIETLKKYYPAKMIGNDPVSTHFLFRGLANQSYQLLPGIFRTQTDTVETFEITNKKYLSWCSEKGILQAFIQEASALLSIPSGNLAQWAEYAQHYGVPTRFLDWSKNPLVALYFCCRDRNTEDGAIWLLHAPNYSRYISKKMGEQNDLGFKTPHMVIQELIDGYSHYEFPILYTPYYVDARMSAQSSYFMIWGTQEKPLEEMMASDDLKMRLPDRSQGEQSYGEHEASAFMFRFHISKWDKQSMLHELDTVGINEKALFPGLDGIGRYIERTYRFDYNEAVRNL